MHLYERKKTHEISYTNFKLPQIKHFCGNSQKVNTHVPLISKETDLIGRNLTYNFFVVE